MGLGVVYGFWGLVCFVNTLKPVLREDMEKDNVAEDGCIFCRGKPYKLQWKLDQILDL